MKEFYSSGSSEPKGDKSSSNPEGSREVLLTGGTPPERPNRDSLWRGLRWIALGSTFIGVAKVTGEESFYQVGLTIASLGGAEAFYGLLYRKK
jgi:hypothetical protein